MSARVPSPDIIAQFPFPDGSVGIERYGSGLINDTWRLTVSDAGLERRFILQRINANVFKDPVAVMQNIQLVTRHIASRQTGPIPSASRAALTLFMTRTGDSHAFDHDGGCWRVFPFIESAITYDTVRDAHHAFEIGRCLGRFQALVADLPPSELHDTLPGFHHTPIYLAEFENALAADPCGRAAGIAAEASFVEQRRQLARRLTDPMEAGAVPIRIVHNDPKVNNVMIDAATGEALCMIDLDTVKPGIIHFDFGDCIRSVTNPAGESPADPNAIGIDLALFEATARGYLREAGPFLTKAERELLALSPLVITYELGVRFLADYLRGDTYFRIRHPEQNLDRARAQFRLLDRMEAASERMTEIVASLAPEGMMLDTPRLRK